MGSGILFAAATACVWGLSGLLGAVSARRVGGVAAALWSYPVGLVLALPIALVAGPPADVASRGSLLGAGGALISVAGLALAFRAGGEGHAGLAFSIVALDGVWAALIAALFGAASVPAPAFAMLVVVTAGFLLLARRDPAGGDLRRPLLLALASGIVYAFAINGFAAGAADDALGPFWQTVLIRIVGTVLVLVLLAGRRLRSPRPALLLVAGLAALEVAGSILYLLAADRAGVAVAAVIAGQFALVTILLGWLVLGERLTRRQGLGAALICGGVAAFTALAA